MGFNINANSTPVYDEWGWADYWQAIDWINWHKALKAAYGHNSANQIFVDAYTNPPSSWELYAHTNFRTTDSEFRKYATENGFLDSLFPGFLNTVVGKTAAIVMKAVGTTQAVANTALDTVEDTADKAAKTADKATDTAVIMANSIKWGVPLLIIGIIYLIYKNHKLIIKSFLPK